MQGLHNRQQPSPVWEFSELQPQLDGVFIINPSQHAAPIPLAQRPIQADALSIPEKFEAFLKDIPDDQEQVNWKALVECNLKSCRAVHRRSCAAIMVELVIKRPGKIAAYSNVVNEIRQSHSNLKLAQVKQPKNQAEQKTFLELLTSICDQEMDKLFKDQASQWTRVHRIGIFLCELYNGHMLKNQLMNKWLVGVQKSTESSPVATKTLLQGLKTIFPRMKFQDKKNYQLCVQTLSNLEVKGKIPKEFQQWTCEILRPSAPSGVPSKAKNVKTKQLLTADVQRPTGTVPKM